MRRWGSRPGAEFRRAPSGDQALDGPAQGHGRGNILIADQFNHQVIEINPAKEIVFSQGMDGVAGTGATGLNAPYDAKSIGDFTGLTPPFEGEGMPDGDD